MIYPIKLNLLLIICLLYNKFNKDNDINYIYTFIILFILYTSNNIIIILYNLIPKLMKNSIK